jgi:hypothetical protein
VEQVIGKNIPASGLPLRKSENSFFMRGPHFDELMPKVYADVFLLSVPFDPFNVFTACEVL